MLFSASQLSAAERSSRPAPTPAVDLSALTGAQELALAISCPKCGACPGVKCIRGGGLRSYAHALRLQTAEERRDAAASATSSGTCDGCNTTTHSLKGDTDARQFCPECWGQLDYLDHPADDDEPDQAPAAKLERADPYAECEREFAEDVAAFRAQCAERSPESAAAHTRDLELDCDGCFEPFAPHQLTTFGDEDEECDLCPACLAESTDDHQEHDDDDDDDDDDDGPTLSELAENLAAARAEVKPFTPSVKRPNEAHKAPPAMPTAEMLKIRGRSSCNWCGAEPTAKGFILYCSHACHDAWYAQRDAAELSPAQRTLIADLADGPAEITGRRRTSAKALGRKGYAEELSLDVWKLTRDGHRIRHAIAPLPKPEPNPLTQAAAQLGVARPKTADWQPVEDQAELNPRRGTQVQLYTPQLTNAHADYAQAQLYRFQPTQGSGERTSYVILRREHETLPRLDHETLTQALAWITKGGPHETLILVACGKDKTAEPAPAQDLYTGPVFAARRTWAESTGHPWAILSGLHGYVAPLTELDPYDLALADQPVAARRAWAAKTFDQIMLRPLPDLVRIHAGRAYVEHLAPLLESEGVQVDWVSQGLAVGQQKAQLLELTATETQPRPVQADDDPSPSTQPTEKLPRPCAYCGSCCDLAPGYSWTCQHCGETYHGPEVEGPACSECRGQLPHDLAELGSKVCDPCLSALTAYVEEHDQAAAA